MEIFVHSIFKLKSLVANEIFTHEKLVLNKIRFSSGKWFWSKSVDQFYSIRVS